MEVTGVNRENHVKNTGWQNTVFLSGKPSDHFHLRWTIII
jgi:hypothetical protein